MKKEFEIPIIEIIYFDLEITLNNASETFFDPNLDLEGWS